MFQVGDPKGVINANHKQSAEGAVQVFLTLKLFFSILIK